jgi:conjugative transposon TraJ protein
MCSMKKMVFVWSVLGVMAVLPLAVRAQDTGLSTAIGGLQGVLDQLYQTMLPLCSQLIGVGQGLAGLAALAYIGIRVGRHLANAEAVEVFPLLRPFGIGLAITLFPALIGMMNGVLSPTVTGTAGMLTNANASIAALLQEKEAAIQNSAAYQVYNGSEENSTLWEIYSNGSAAGGTAGGLGAAFSFLVSKAYYNMKNTVKVWLSEILQVLYEAAALCINTIRTFQLLVLAILGPLVLGLSVFDGFQHTLLAWLARYINVYLWLPVANIFGAIIANVQTQMIQLDIAQIQATGDTSFSSTDVAYLVFLIIGIVGYFTVPATAGYIVNVGGGGALSGKMTALAGSGAQRVSGAAGGLVGGLAGAPGALMAGYRSGGGDGKGSSWASQAGRAYGRASQQRNKISG